MCEAPTIYEDVVRKARKVHKCCECSEPILVGENYCYFKGLYDGSWSSYKQHTRCRDLMNEVSNVWHPDCVAFTEVKEAYLELNIVDDFNGLVPAAWVEKAKTNLAAREKLYGVLGSLPIIDIQRNIQR